MTSIKMEGNPAFERIPPWAKAKLRPQAIEMIQKVFDWVETECVPAEPIYKAQLEKDRWTTPPIMHELRKRAKEAGLFNIFLPNHFKESPGLTNLEYSCCAEIMGRVYWAAQVSFNLLFGTITELIKFADYELSRSRDR
jgi:alkylation response protein AidB-like acyl-CoA dehydrogenase